MNRKKYFSTRKIGWSCAAALLLSLATSTLFAQPHIMYHSFNSGVSRNAVDNATITSLLGQSIFGISRLNGTTVFSGYTAHGKGILSSVKNTSEIAPGKFALYQNYPNPFNPSTTIRYGLPSPSRVSLKIYNILGQQIAEIINKEQSEGSYEVLWNADGASGLYFYRLDAVSMSDPNQKYSQLNKMVLLR
jgi:hypothetical protein